MHLMYNPLSSLSYIERIFKWAKTTQMVLQQLYSSSVYIKLSFKNKSKLKDITLRLNIV